MPSSISRLTTSSPLLLVDGGDEHTVALLPHHLARGQVHDGDEGLAHEVLGLVPLAYAGEDLAVGAGAVVEDELEQLVALLDGLAALDLDDAEVALAEGVEIDVLGQLRLDLHGGQGLPAASSSSFSSSSSSLAMSMRGKSVSPFRTNRYTYRGSLPHSPAASQLRSCAGTPSWSAALTVLSGMKGVSSWVQMRRASSRLYMTVARRARLASSLASSQGAVSSIYLFARETTLKTSSSAAWVLEGVHQLFVLCAQPPAMEFSSQSAPSVSRSVGRAPSKYFITIATVRLSRLP